MSATRREVLAAGALLAAGAALTGRSTQAAAPTEGEAGWLGLLATSMHGERDYAARIEGRLPAALRGTLYRNGPGLFERAGFRKQHLLDGDGMLQAYRFADDGIRYRNRFVRTPKFVEEEQAEAFLYPTWGSFAPGWLANIPAIPPKSQAGITAVWHHGRLFAFDEVGPPFRCVPDDLATIEPESPTGGEAAPPAVKAHTRIDPETGDWILLGYEMGRTATLHVIVRDRDGRLKAHHRMASPRQTYIHDFFATRRHVVVNLHAVDFSPFAMLAGLRTFIGSLTWRAEQGNLVLVIDRDTGAATTLEAPASFMWHAFNAYEDADGIVADFVGYAEPDHFIGDDPMFAALVEGRLGQARHPGLVRRWRIDLRAKRLREEVLGDESTEFPMINPAVALRPHRYGYTSVGSDSNILHDGVARFDFVAGAADRFHFGPGHLVGEPVFVADPGAGGDAEAAGWLLVQGLERAGGNSFLAVLRADALADGPVAVVRLDHPVPISFHGCWRAA